MGSVVAEQVAERTDTRGALRQRNRQALIEATLDCVSELGIARTSVSTIIARAGLSRGMIHLHFESKDKLLEAAIAHANAIYYQQLEAMLAQAGPSPQDTIDAIVRSDLSEAVLNRRYVSIWYAFRGEAREREIFKQYSDTRDEGLSAMARDAILTMLNSSDASDTGDAAAIAEDAAEGLLAMLEGMWTDFLLHPDEFDRDRACRICFRYMQAFLPEFFSAAGARTV